MMRREMLLVVVLIAAVVLSGTTSAAGETFEQGHQRLYATGELLKVSDLVDLGPAAGGSVTSVSIRYNMVRSALEVDWLYNGEVIGHSALKSGQRKTASFDYGKRIPAAIDVRFAGPSGYVQVLSIQVIASPAQQVMAGSAARTTADREVVSAGAGVSAAQTPTPRQLGFIEPTRILPTDPKAEGFDDSECERLICTLPPEKLKIGDTGQQRVSSFYLLIQRASRAAREEMPPPGRCAWWDRPMTGDDPSQILAAAYNTRIDIEITWKPDMTYSFRPNRSNINLDQESPARFIKLWDSVMAGGWVDLCVEPRKVDSVTYLAVVGQY